MKNKYEDFKISIFLIIVLLIIEAILIIILINNKLSIYYVFNGIIYKDKCIQIVVDDAELKIINSNKALYFNNKKHFYEVIDIDRDIINNYNLISLKVNIDGRVNDIVSISVFSNRIRVIEMFKIIWKEWWYEKDWNREIK